MKRQDPVTDHILAVTLKAGAYSAFALIVAGLLLQWAAGLGSKVTIAGLLVLLATPALRIVVAGVQFLREHDWKYLVISVGVLAIVMLAYFLGIQA